MQNYDEFNEMVTPLLDEDKMTMVPVVRDRRNIENEILTKVIRDRDAQLAKNVIKIKSPPKANAKKGKTTKKASSPKAKTMKKTSPPVLAAPRCKSNEIINPTTGKCMRITTMIKQVIKKNNMPLGEGDIDFFMDVAREKKLSLGSEREITSALYILLNTGIIKSKAQ